MSHSWKDRRKARKYQDGAPARRGESPFAADLRREREESRRQERRAGKRIDPRDLDLEDDDVGAD